MAGVCSNQRDWAFLFPEAIDKIVEKLDDSFSAFMSFISVCQNWRVVALDGTENKDDNRKKRQILQTCRNKLPLLIIESPTGSAKNERRFHVQSQSLDNNRRICSRYQLDRHMEIGWQYFGSSFGWLFAEIHNHPRSIPIIDFVLFNPLTCVDISLPLFPGDQPRSVGGYNTGVLSSDPSKQDYELVVIHNEGKGLARYKSHTNSWTLMDVYEEYELVDVVFYRGKIYASSRAGHLIDVDFDTRNTRVVVVIPSCSYETTILVVPQLVVPPLVVPPVVVPHLVVSTEGDLLMVKQMANNCFKVYKLSCCPQEGWRWEETNNLGDQALFVGRHSDRSNFTACVSSLEFPQCQPNCIYYIRSTSCRRDKEERGVFNLELKQHFKFPCAVTGVVATSYQFWVVPSLI